MIISAHTIKVRTDKDLTEVQLEELCNLIQWKIDQLQNEIATSIRVFDHTIDATVDVT